MNFRFSAAYGGGKALICINGNHSVRETTDQFQKKSRRNDDASLFEDAALYRRIDPDSGVISGQLQNISRSLKQNSFQCGNRAFCGCSTGDIADGGQKIFLFTLDFQKITSLEK